MTAALFVITTPRDLALPGRLLRSLLGGIDRVNPFLAGSQPRELEFDAVDRLGQVAGFSSMRDAMCGALNRRRLHAWAARYRPHAGEVSLPPTATPLVTVIQFQTRQGRLAG